MTRGIFCRQQGVTKRFHSSETLEGWTHCGLVSEVYGIQEGWKDLGRVGWVWV